MTGRSLRMFWTTWVTSGVPIKWIVLPHYNKKIVRYFSRFLEPGYIGHRCFYAVVEYRYWPIGSASLSYSQTLAYMYNQGAEGTLVVPLWNSAVFWPMLTNVYYTCTQDLRVLSMSQALIHVRNRNSILASPTTPGYLTIIPWARVGYEMVNSQRGA